MSEGGGSIDPPSDIAERLDRRPADGGALPQHVPFRKFRRSPGRQPESVSTSAARR